MMLTDSNSNFTVNPRVIAKVHMPKYFRTVVVVVCGVFWQVLGRQGYEFDKGAKMEVIMNPDNFQFDVSVSSTMKYNVTD